MDESLRPHLLSPHLDFPDFSLRESVRASVDAVGSSVSRPPGCCRNVRNSREGGIAGGIASLRSRTCVKRNAVFRARFKGLSLHFLYQKRNLIRIKTGSDTYLIHIQNLYPGTVPPCHGTPTMIILRLCDSCPRHCRQKLHARCLTSFRKPLQGPPTHRALGS